MSEDSNSDTHLLNEGEEEEMSEEELNPEPEVLELLSSFEFIPAGAYPNIATQIESVIKQHGDTPEGVQLITEQIFKSVFDSEDYMGVLEEMYKDKKKPQGFCRKVMQEPGGYGYRCLECMGQYDSVFVCVDCFMRSNHHGHTYDAVTLEL